MSKPPVTDSDELVAVQYQPAATPPPRPNSKLQYADVLSLQQTVFSSNLSSLPPILGATSEGLMDRLRIRPLEQVRATRAKSPLRRSKRDRKAVKRPNEYDSDGSYSSATKRRKFGLASVKYRSGSSTAVSSPVTPQLNNLSQSESYSQVSNQPDGILPAASAAQGESGQHSSNDTGKPRFAVAESNCRAEPLTLNLRGTSSPNPLRVKENEKLEMEIAQAFLAKSQNRTFEPQYSQDRVEGYLHRFPATAAARSGQDREDRKCDKPHPGFDTTNPTYYHADGITKTASSNAGHPGSNHDSAAPSPSAKGGKNSGIGKVGSGLGKGKVNKGRATGAGGGRDRDSPEPSNKTPMTQEDKRLLAHIRARQAELRRFYATVVAQQKEALEIIASKDVTRLLRKHRAHTKMGEFEEIVKELQLREQDTDAIIRKEYEMQVALANEQKRAREAVIESQMHKRVLASKEEHAKGAQGDLIIFHKAHRAAGDETKTDNGSDVEGYFPRYHEMPEPDTGPRGYNSLRINDEKSFKEHLASYDEQAQRDVIEDDIVGPVVQSVAEQNARRESDQEKKVRFESLVSVAEAELKERKEYPIPRPLPPSENPQFALSRLADCAEYISRAHPNQAYVSMPIAHRDLQSFPRHSLEKVPSPSPPEEVPAISAPQPQSSNPRKPIPRRNKSLSVHVKRLSKEEDSQSQPSSNTSTPLPAIAPAPSRMPPPPMGSQHHHHHLLPQPMVPTRTGSLPPPLPARHSSVSAPRPQSLAPLITSRSSIPQTSPPATPTTGQTPIMSAQGHPQGQPAPPPGPFGPGPTLAQHRPPLSQPVHYPPPGSYQARPSFPLAVQQPPRLERPTAHSPVGSTTPVEQPQHRFSISSSTQGPPKARLGGPRRAPGEITFTNVQTPNSERFRSPSQPPANQPGQAVLRPGTAPNTPNGLGTGKIANTFVNAAPDANSRSQQAADAARQNATINAVQGAGPKGGRRVLLPKGHRY